MLSTIKLARRTPLLSSRCCWLFGSISQTPERDPTFRVGYTTILLRNQGEKAECPPGSRFSPI